MSDDSQHYSVSPYLLRLHIFELSSICNVKNLAGTYADLWQSSVLSSGSDPQHIVANFGDSDTMALTYNLYADKLLQTNVVNQSVSNVRLDGHRPLINPSTQIYQQQTTFLGSSLASNTG